MPDNTMGRWLLACGAMAVGLACDDGPIDPRPTDDEPRGLRISDTVAVAIEAPAYAGSIVGFSATAEVGFTYVSLPPGTVENGMVAIVSNTRSGTNVTTAMSEGGFDPIRIDAVPGDSLVTAVQVLGTSTPTTFSAIVPAFRRPTIVRTSPPRKKRDIPLNTRIIVVFSEPVSPGSARSGVTLTRAGSVVPGETALDPSGLIAEFTPSALLTANTEYEVRVATTVVDLDGDAVAAQYDAVFTTGTTTVVSSIVTEQPAIIMNPYVGTLRTFEMRAELHDDGAVRGEWNIFYIANGLRTGGHVTCMSIADREGWVGGVAEYSNGSQEAVGIDWGWRVGDDTPTPTGERDQLSLAFPLADSQLGNAEAFCAGRPIQAVDPTDGATIAIQPHALHSGNIVIRGPGEPQPPPPAPPPPRPIGLSRIAYAAAPDGGLRIIDADGLGFRVLTRDNDWSPSWSPDGTRLVFQRNRASGGADLFVVNADGTELRQLTNGPGFVAGPAWSPDGRFIAHYRNGALYVMNADGTGARLLTDNGAHPSWSPDSRRIAFWRSEGRYWGVFVVNADGSGVQRLTVDTANASNPAWSRDGTRIAFQGDDGLYVMNADGTQIRRVALCCQTPAWSPDDQMLAYDEYGLTTIRLDGTEMRKHGNGFTPSWSPGTTPPRGSPSVLLSVLSGDGQRDTVGAVIDPLIVKVARTDGTPVPGVSVRFHLYTSNKYPDPRLSNYSTLSDPGGLARTSMTLGETPAQYRVQAVLPEGNALNAGVEFRVTAAPGNPQALLTRRQLPPVATPGDSLLVEVAAFDGHKRCPDPSCGNAVSGVPITWTLESGTGALLAASDSTAMDDYGEALAAAELVPTAEGPVVLTASSRQFPDLVPARFTTDIVTRIVLVFPPGFGGSSVTVPVGKTVAWRWVFRPSTHNVTFEDDLDGTASSPDQSGGIFKRTFAGPARTVRYRCTLHSTSFTAGEVGEVEVLAAP